MASIAKDGCFVFPIRTAAGVFGANGSYRFTLEPGTYALEVWSVGTGVDVQVFPVTPAGTRMGTAYNAMLLPTSGTGTDPVTTALTVATGRRLRCVSMMGGNSTNALANSVGYVTVAQLVDVVLTNTSAITELYLVAAKVSK